jgi:MFS family permease
MDKNTPREDAPTQPPKPARVALNVLALCFALSVLGRGLGESFTVFLKPISEDFGWDRAQVVSVFSLSWLAGGLTAPLVGRLFDRSGPRMVYSLGLLLLGAAFLVASHAQHLWQVQLSVGLCVGLGIALIGNVPNSILLGRWFGPRLPTAMAILYSATGAGILVLLPASQVLIDRIGWRDAYQLFGIVALCLLLPLLVLPWRLFATGSPHIARKADAGFVDNGWTLGSAMRHHAFWALFCTFFFTAVAMYAITAQIVAYLIDAGFPPLQAATAWGFSGVVLLFGMLGISTLDGIIGRRPSVLFSYGVSIVGIILLWLIQYYPNYWLLTGFVKSFGSMIGSRGPLITATALNIFRGERVGTIYGTISIGSGQALGWARRRPDP